MKVAIATTTIHVPAALELMREYGFDVGFFVAGDQKSPHGEIENLANRVGDYFRYLAPDTQTKWKCSELIGWGTLARRNIATLEALAWGADAIVVWDNDNIPLGPTYFSWFRAYLDYPFSGIKVSSPTGWFDVGTLLDPVAPHRGFPHDIESKKVVSHVVGAKVGVAAGICLGDPDIDAVYRMAVRPIVHRTSELLNSGIVVDIGSDSVKRTWTVFNSQNTAFLRELAPAMFFMPGVGRHDDIYASLITQKVMQSRGLHVHFGKPFVWQQRNDHNLVTDLRKEIDGMENVVRLQKYLSHNTFLEHADKWPIADHVRAIYRGFNNLPHGYDLVPQGAVDAALAFLDDIEGLL